MYNLQCTIYNLVQSKKNRSSQGYTLIELLVVIAIIGLLSLVGFVNFKSFSADQVVVKAAGQIQSYLKLAQTNATTSTKCPDPAATDQGATSWYLVFNDFRTIYLRCDTATTTNFTYRSYILDTNAQIFSTTCSPFYPFSITYTIGNGMSSNSCDIIVSNSLTPTAVNKKTITITTGGSINVH